LKIIEKEPCKELFWLFIVSEHPNTYDMPVMREDNLFELFSVLEDYTLEDKGKDEPIPLK